MRILRISRIDDRISRIRTIFKYANYVELTPTEYADLDHSSYDIFEEQLSVSYKTRFTRQELWLDHVSRMQNIFCIDRYFIFFYNATEQRALNMLSKKFDSILALKRNVLYLYCN